MSVPFATIEQEAPELMPFAKTAESAISRNGLNGQKSKVALALDFSMSMHESYSNGSMQRLAEKILALATQLNDEGTIDLFIFDTKAHYVGEVTVANFRNIVEELTKNHRMGGTDYADLFRKLVDFYKFPSEADTSLKSPVEEPVLVVFLTDGASSNDEETVRELTKSSFSPVFWRFVSVGDLAIPFLENLHELTDLGIANTAHSHVGDVESLTDDVLFDLILDGYLPWLEQRQTRQVQ